MHLFARAPHFLPFPEVVASLGDATTEHLGLSPEDTGRAIRRILGEHTESAQVYVCGPAPMIGATVSIADALGWPEESVHFEYFAIDTVRAGAHRLFRVADQHLWFAEQEGHDWLVPAAHPTIADLALFPDVILSEEGGVHRQDYPALHRWTDRVKRIDGFTPMPGIFPAAPARVQ